MSGNVNASRQRLTLSNLTEPQQMRELNRQRNRTGRRAGRRFSARQAL